MRLSRIILGPPAVFAALIAAAPAAADTVQFPLVPSMYYGGFCWSSIRSWADTGPAWPGQAIINIQSQPIAGIGPGTYSAAPLCNVLTTVDWRNTNTGATGRYQVVVVTGIYGSIQYALFQPTGPGHIDVTVYTNNANIPAHSSFDVPAGALSQRDTG